jgi:hypothetical protein
MLAGMPRGCWPATKRRWPRLTSSGHSPSSGSRRSTSHSWRSLRQESWRMMSSWSRGEHTGAISRRMRVGARAHRCWSNPERVVGLAHCLRLLHQDPNGLPYIERRRFAQNGHKVLVVGPGEASNSVAPITPAGRGNSTRENMGRIARRHHRSVPYPVIGAKS